MHDQFHPRQNWRVRERCDLIELAVAEYPQQKSEREFFIDNLLVRIHLIIAMIRWTGLAPWENENSTERTPLLERKMAPKVDPVEAEAGNRCRTSRQSLLLHYSRA